MAATTAPRVSIVINTLNRAESLRRTLRSLELLDHQRFEVVVVDGPSTDHTAEVLAEFAGRIKTARCPEPNLSMSRNIGIAVAAGDAVAFLDDDAYPDPAWLDELVPELFGADEVAGVGGPVLDHTGAAYQAHYSLADRLGEAWTSSGPNPTDWVGSPWSPVFVYLMGTNAVYRREHLVGIGGYDEEYEYYLDDTDVAVRLTDRGWLLKALDRGLVYHKFLPSDVRNERRAVTNRFPVLKNRRYFALRFGGSVASPDEIGRALDGFVDHHRRDLDLHVRQGALEREERARFEADVARAAAAADEAAARGPRTRPAAWFEARQEPFLPFPTRRPADGRLHVCIVSQEYLPGQLNGIARVLYTVATELGAEGHVVRVVTEAGTAHPTVDLEGDVWVHRVPAPERPSPADLDVPPAIWRFPAAVLDEIRRIDAVRPVDVVQIPNWGSEGAALLYAGGFRTVMGLYSPVATVAQLDHRLDPTHPHNAALIALERDGYQLATALLACGPSIVEEIEARYDLRLDRARLGVVPHGLPDVVLPSLGDPDAPTILFVGRLEPRKGIDTLLDAMPEVLRRTPGARLLVAGDDTIVGPDGRTYADRFRADPGVADVVSRVRFLGVVDERALEELYASCDVFVAPSRYESFGLIAVEAMRAGKPVVASAVGGLAEIVVPGETGALVPAGDADALRDAVLDVLAGDAVAMGKEGRRAYEERFTSRRMAADIVAFYRSVLAADASAPVPTGGAGARLTGDEGVLALLQCPVCAGPLRPWVEAASADGRLKEGDLICDRCACVAAAVADFRIDFHAAGARRPTGDEPGLVVPVLGEWRVRPGGPEAPADGAWEWASPHLVSAGRAGDHLSFSARFTDLVVRMARTRTSGRVGVTVDGAHTTTIDLFEPDSSWVVGVPLVTNAKDVLHTVELTVLGESDAASSGAQVHVEELVVKGPIGPGRPFAVPGPVNRGNPFSPFIEQLLAGLPPGTPVLEIGGGDRRRAVPGHLNFEYLPFELADMYGDIHHLPFRDSTFDVICSQAVFEHVTRPFDAARELVRVARPGGTIFTEAAFLQPLHAVPHHYFNMTRAGLRELFSDCEVVDEGWFGPMWLTFDWMLRATGLREKVPHRRLDRLVREIRELDELVDHETMEVIASGVYVTVRTPGP